MGKVSILLSSFLGFIGFIRLLLPGIASDFFSIDLVVALLCIGLAGLTFAYEYSSLSRIDLSEIWAALGILLGAAFIVLVYTPTLGNLRQYYVSVSDMLLIAESAVVCGLAYSRRKPNTVHLSAYAEMAWLLASSYLWRSFNFPNQQQAYRHKHAQ